MIKRDQSVRGWIRRYQESEWRSHRLEILSKIGKFRDLRSFRFLADLIVRNEDLAEQIIAIRSMARRRDRLASRWILNFYRVAPASLKSELSHALGWVRARAAVPDLIRDLQHAQESGDSIWERNIVLALGELKAHSALPLLRKRIEANSLDLNFRMALILSLGKMERDGNYIDSLEEKFIDDSIGFQLYQSVRAQVWTRSQFRLQDYLQKIQGAEVVHPSLPRELVVFTETEIQHAIQKWSPRKQWRELLSVIPVLSVQNRKIWLDQIHEAMAPEEEVEFWDRMELQADDPDWVVWAKRQRPSAEAKLSWLKVVADQIEWDLILESDLSIETLNLWNEWANVHLDDHNISQWQSWLESVWPRTMEDAVRGRLIRSAVELGLATPDLTQKWFQSLVRDPQSSLAGSLLMAIERFSYWIDSNHFVAWVTSGFSGMPLETQKAQFGRVAAILESLLGNAHETSRQTIVAWFLQLGSDADDPELAVPILRVLRTHAFPEFEAWVCRAIHHSNPKIEMAATVALKFYRNSATASEALAQKLKSDQDSIRGRALDSLCQHDTIFASWSVLHFLRDNLFEDAVVDKVCRSFDPQKKGGNDYAYFLQELMNTVPHHPQWEKLGKLRDRLQQKVAPAVSTAATDLDQAILKLLPKFSTWDVSIQSAIRAAEQPFHEDPASHQSPIDRAPSVLEYCKAMDLLLEKNLGQQKLFPKLETSIHEFQVLLSELGFREDYPDADRVLLAIGLKGKIEPERFPLHKAKMISKGFFNGKILHDRFKVFDGLRAWAVILLLFVREYPKRGLPNSLLPLGSHSEKVWVSLAQRLMTLQDLRNPAAHRQTYLELASVQSFRQESLWVMNVLGEI